MAELKKKKKTETRARLEKTPSSAKGFHDLN